MIPEPVGHWWEKVRDFIGDLWGRTTTLVLALLVAALPTLETLPAEVREFLPWWAKLAIGLGGTTIAVLRIVAPPPPAVVMKKDDEVHIDHATSLVSIIKATEIPDTIESKPAGEAVTAGEVTI